MRLGQVPASEVDTVRLSAEAPAQVGSELCVVPGDQSCREGRVADRPCLVGTGQAVAVSAADGGQVMADTALGVLRPV